MKRLLMGLAFLLCTVSVRAAEPPVCIEKGTVMETGCFDAEGAIAGYERITVASTDKTPEGWTKVTCRAVALDKDRKPLMDGENNKGVPELDYVYLIRKDVMVRLMPFDLASFGIDGDGVRMTVSGNEYTVPIDPVAGTVLPDVAMKFSIHIGEGHIPVKFKVVDRTVSGKEKIMTRAGEFEAFKITEKVTVSVFIVSDSYLTEAWYVPGIGLVRENRCTRRGKLESYSELLSVRRP